MRTIELQVVEMPLVGISKSSDGKWYAHYKREGYMEGNIYHSFTGVTCPVIEIGQSFLTTGRWWEIEDANTPFNQFPCGDFLQGDEIIVNAVDCPKIPETMEFVRVNNKFFTAKYL